MTDRGPVPEPEIAKVDRLVDEKGAPVELPADTGLKVAGDGDPTVGKTTPTNWWGYGLVGLAIVIAILFVMQMFAGAPGTDVQPGSPTAEPVTDTEPAS